MQTGCHRGRFGQYALPAHAAFIMSPSHHLCRFLAAFHAQITLPCEILNPMHFIYTPGRTPLVVISSTVSRWSHDYGSSVIRLTSSSTPLPSQPCRPLEHRLPMGMSPTARVHPHSRELRRVSRASSGARSRKSPLKEFRLTTTKRQRLTRPGRRLELSRIAAAKPAPAAITPLKHSSRGRGPKVGLPGVHC